MELRQISFSKNNETMKRLRYSGLIGLMLLCLSVPTSAQALKIKSTISIHDTLLLSGHFQPVSDTALYVAANGGIFNLLTNKWFISPEPQKYILSFHIERQPELIAYLTYFHEESKEYALYRFYQTDQYRQMVRVVTLPKDFIFYPLVKQDVLYLMGIHHTSGFILVRVHGNLLDTLLESNQFAPDSYTLKDRSTLLFAIKNNVYAFTAYSGLQKLIEIPQKAEGLAIGPSGALYISTGSQILQLNSENVFEPIFHGKCGPVSIKYHTLYNCVFSDNYLNIFYLEGS